MSQWLLAPYLEQGQHSSSPRWARWVSVCITSRNVGLAAAAHVVCSAQAVSALATAVCVLATLHGQQAAASCGVGRGGARAALRLVRQRAGRLLALELALGLGAVGGLDALVGAVERLADGRALGLGRLARGVAAGRLADRLALGAAVLLALLLGAADRADGALAVDRALGAGRLLALHLALGARAHGVAHGGARWVIALPLALRVALLSGDGNSQEEDNSGDELHLFLRTGR